MKERSIIFSGPDVRAILDGRKTQARWLMGPQPIPRFTTDIDYWVSGPYSGELGRPPNSTPFGLPGDRLWVKEKWQYKRQQYCTCPQPSEASPCDDWMDGTGCKSNRSEVVYAATSSELVQRWRPSTHMPRWASRITLEVVDVRVQQVRDITEADAIAEGVDAVSIADVPRQATWTRRQDFSHLWERLHGPGAWDRNDWVWALTFRLHRLETQIA